MSLKLKINLLGEVSIQKGKKAVAGLPSRAAEALFVYLACNQRSFTRETLAELLWADRTSTQGLTNLRTILTSLRRELDDYLLISRDALEFNAASEFWIDVNEFEDQLKGMGLPDRGAIPADAVSAEKLRSALDLYRGDFLEGFHLRDGQGFEEWTLLQRERLKRLARDGYRLLSGYYLESGQYAEGSLTASRWQRLDPYDEDACRTQMWMLLRAGQRSDALKCYQTLKEKLQKDLGVAPSPTTTDLFQKFQQTDFPPKTNLPKYSAGFLGRQQELDELANLLISREARLVTIVGPGGIGKTRLAVEAARSFVEQKPGRFLNGVGFVPLATIESPQEIPARIADAIGFSFKGQDALQKQLLDHLKDKETLLVLDNLEHLFDESGSGIALIVDMLRGAPNLKILVTSRERVNLYEEVVFDVSGLDVPNEDNDADEGFSAIALFLQGARRIQRNYRLDKNERQAVARICRLVEGMPLAIELASSWIRNYPSTQIAAHIESDLDFLASPYKDVSAGHRSLRTVFERSWSLLTSDEQIIYTQLTIFRSGFTIEAAKSVVHGNAIGVEIALSSLVDKSLVQRQPDERYDIHPILHQFAAEKLSASGLDLETLSANQALYYLKFLSDLGDGESPQQRTLIRPERDNIRLAWETAAVSGMLNELEQTASVLHGFFSMESWFQEGIDLFGRAIELLIEKKHPGTDGLLCDLLGRKARMHTQIGQLESARIGSQQALSYLEHVDDPSRRSRALDSLAITSYYGGDYQRASELAEQSLQLSQQTENLDGVAFSLNFLGSCAKAQGKNDQCRDYFERAVKAYQTNEDEIGAAMVMNNLGNLLQILEDFSGAQQYYLQSSEIFKAQDHIHGAATTLANAGKLAGRLGDYPLAEKLLNESLVLKRKINDQRGEAVALAGLGDVAMLTGKRKEARTYFRPALEIANRVGDTQLTLDILAAIGLLLSSDGRAEIGQHLTAYVLHHPGISEEARQRVAGKTESPPSETAITNPWNVDPVSDIVERIVIALGN